VHCREINERIEHPVAIGIGQLQMEAGGVFGFELGRQAATSEHVGFGKNRVMETSKNSSRAMFTRTTPCFFTPKEQPEAGSEGA
jgi:hypothetical protein